VEERLARRPKISVPSVTLDGISDALKPGGTADQEEIWFGYFLKRFNQGIS